MDVVHELGRATVAEIRERLEDPSSYSSIRTIVRILESKGHLRHRKDGRRFVYSPVVSRARARRTAMDRLVATFFEGSVEGALVAFLQRSKGALSEETARQLRDLIDDAEKRGR